MTSPNLDAAAMSLGGGNGEPTVIRLDGSALPTLYELYFNLERYASSVLTPAGTADAAESVASDSFPSAPAAFGTYSFDAIAKIHITAATNLKTITMHALNLDIRSVRWAVRTDEDLAPDAAEDDPVPSTRSASAQDPSVNVGASADGLQSIDASSPAISAEDDGSCPISFRDDVHHVQTWRIDTTAETLKFDLGETIATNRQIVLWIEYSAPINRDETNGLFIADKSNDLTLATHLEPADARRLFPCFDEPQFQARFRVSVRVPELPGYQLLSNTKESERTPHTDIRTPSRAASGRFLRASQLPSSAALDPLPTPLAAAGGSGVSTGEPQNTTNAAFPAVPPETSVSRAESIHQNVLHNPPQPASLSAIPHPLRFSTTTFRMTPAIVPYVVAWTFGPVHCVEAETKSGVITRVFLPTSQPLQNAWFTLDLLKKAVEFFENYFDFPLPMQKLDIVALPHFGSLGMENWGLMFFDANHVAVSETTPLERQQRIARLVGHETAHQWFGNLVALRWWRYIWLKEGLARYLEYVFVSSLLPKWDMWLNFVVDIQNTALLADANSDWRHAVEITTPLPPRVIADYFDTISYGKAASIMRMVGHLLGGEAQVSAALKSFVHRHAWSTATSDDLYVCLQEQLAKSVAANTSSFVPPRTLTIERLVSKWVTSVGPPLLYVWADPKELRSSSPSNKITFHVRAFECPNMNNGFIEAIKNRPSSPGDALARGGTEDSDPLLGRTKDRSNKGTRPSSVIIDHTEHLRPVDVPCPVSATASIGANNIGHTIFCTLDSSDHQFDLKIHAPDSAATKDQGISLTVNGTSHFAGRIDYSTDMWINIIANMHLRPAKERLSIAVALFEQRAFLVGARSTSDRVDRCVLLLQFIYQLGLHRERHAIIWSYVSQSLERFITLIQDHPCWPDVRLLIMYAHRELLTTKVISFHAPPKDPVLDYKASHDISAKTRMALLQTMARCGEPDIVNEAVAYSEWCIAAFCTSPVLTPAASFTGGLPTLGSSLSEGQQTASLLAPPEPPMPQYWFKKPESMHDVHCDVRKVPFDKLTIAFETAVSFSDSPRLFWAMLQLFGALNVRDPNVWRTKDMPNEVLAVDLALINSLDPSVVRDWMNALVPALLACPLSVARQAQFEVLARCSFTAPLLRTLFDNGNLLVRYLDEKSKARVGAYSIDKATADIKRYAILNSANALVATWLASNTSTPKDDLFRNCTWADYVSEHYSWFVKQTMSAHFTQQDGSLTESFTFSGAGQGSTPDSARRCSI